jgi:hypothetical protein
VPGGAIGVVLGNSAGLWYRVLEKVTQSGFGTVCFLQQQEAEEAAEASEKEAAEAKEAAAAKAERIT